MTQPEFVPVEGRYRVRSSRSLAVPASWTVHRPGEGGAASLPGGTGGGERGGRGSPGGPGVSVRHGAARSRGRPGPDKGFALKLAHDAVATQGRLHEGENEEDIVAGVGEIAAARAANLGRAPVGEDVEFALDLYEFRSTAPGPGTLERRRRLFASVARSYHARVALVDSALLEP